MRKQTVLLIKGYNMKIDVLDKGYIELVDSLGDDLTPVNAARVSFGGRSDKFTDQDKQLSNFLIHHNDLCFAKVLKFQVLVLANLLSSKNRF